MLPARTATGSAPAGRPASARCRAPTRTSRQRWWPARPPTCRTWSSCPAAARAPTWSAGRRCCSPTCTSTCSRPAGGWSTGPARTSGAASPTSRTTSTSSKVPTQGRRGPVKVQLCGPWTLAAALRLTRGEPVLSDAGAVRDLVQSLTDGAVQHLSDVRRRLPDAPLVLQLDEPSLPAVLAGGIRSSSGARSFPPVPSTTVEETLRALVDAVGVPVVVHCCAERPPVARPRPRRGERAVAGPDRPRPGGRRRARRGGRRRCQRCSPASSRRCPERADGCPTRRVRSSRCAGCGAGSGCRPRALRRVVVTPTCGLAGRLPGPRPRRPAARRRRRPQLAEDPEG